MIIENVTLYGFAIAEARIHQYNHEGRLVYNGIKLISTMIECPAIKKVKYVEIDGCTIDESEYDYEETDIIPVDSAQWCEIFTNGHKYENDNPKKTIDKLLHIYKYDLEE